MRTDSKSDLSKPNSPDFSCTPYEKSRQEIFALWAKIRGATFLVRRRNFFLLRTKLDLRKFVMQEIFILHASPPDPSLVI